MELSGAAGATEWPYGTRWRPRGSAGDGFVARYRAHRSARRFSDSGARGRGREGEQTVDAERRRRRRGPSRGLGRGHDRGRHRDERCRWTRHRGQTATPRRAIAGGVVLIWRRRGLFDAGVRDRYRARSMLIVNTGGWCTRAVVVMPGGVVGGGRYRCRLRVGDRIVAHGSHAATRVSNLRRENAQKEDRQRQSASDAAKRERHS